MDDRTILKSSMGSTQFIILHSPLEFYMSNKFHPKLYLHNQTPFIFFLPSCLCAGNPPSVFSCEPVHLFPDENNLSLLRPDQPYILHFSDEPTPIPLFSGESTPNPLFLSASSPQSSFLINSNFTHLSSSNLNYLTSLFTSESTVNPLFDGDPT